jgi:hypothetical protein
MLISGFSAAICFKLFEAHVTQSLTIDGIQRIKTLSTENNPWNRDRDNLRPILALLVPKSAFVSYLHKTIMIP